MSTIEMGQLKFHSETNGEIIHIRVEGSINEDLLIEKVADLKNSRITFDLEKVKMINSCGIREWIRLVEQHGQSVNIEYINVPQIVVQQMNMIAGFLSKNAKVVSFYAPYFIEDLDEERQVLLRAEEIRDFKAPKMNATVDGTEYELDFDAIEEQYFRFLKR
jgi:anti-anti-sigma regulatory factor